MINLFLLYQKKFQKSQDKRAALLEEIEQLLKQARSLSQQQRNGIAEQLATAYIKETEKRPDQLALYLLGNFILSDYIHDPDPMKRSRIYSFMTPTQERRSRRLNREIAMGDWEITDLPQTGYRSASYTNDQGILLKTRQPINQFDR